MSIWKSLIHLMSTGPVLPRVRWFAICICLFRLSLVNSQLCNSAIYGTPNIQHCYEALRWVPYIRMMPSFPPAQQLRVFSEPQYLEPPFANLNNPYRPEGIIQLPKIYRHSKLHQLAGIDMQRRSLGGCGTTLLQLFPFAVSRHAILPLTSRFYLCRLLSCGNCKPRQAIAARRDQSLVCSFLAEVNRADSPT